MNFLNNYLIISWFYVLHAWVMCAISVQSWQNFFYEYILQPGLLCYLLIMFSVKSKTNRIAISSLIFWFWFWNKPEVCKTNGLY